MIQSSIIALFCIGLGTAASLGFYYGKRHTSHRIRQKLQRLELYDRCWREQQGRTEALGAYHLISLDGESTWISVEQNEKGFRIVGELEPYLDGDIPPHPPTSESFSRGSIRFSSPIQNEIYNRAQKQWKKPETS